MVPLTELVPVVKKHWTSAFERAPTYYASNPKLNRAEILLSGPWQKKLASSTFQISYNGKPMKHERENKQRLIFASERKTQVQKILTEMSSTNFLALKSLQLKTNTRTSTKKLHGLVK